MHRPALGVLGVRLEAVEGEREVEGRGRQRRWGGVPRDPEREPRRARITIAPSTEFSRGKSKGRSAQPKLRGERERDGAGARVGSSEEARGSTETTARGEASSSRVHWSLMMALM